jgi:exopolyphosphatase / guanosine-5'-triphosphate,3'-diphosphate pyrophosphatase
MPSTPAREAGAARVAVIDLGSNSTRLLVADVVAGRVTELERRSEVTRMARGVDLSGQLAAEAVEAVCAVVAGYVDAYERYDVDQVVAVATSAVRDSSNGAAFVAELRERFELGARLLSGEQEARLTYLGATAGRRQHGRTLVFDIGGGSTELIMGDESGVRTFRSLQLGVVRHSERHINSDPPAQPELETLAEAARAEIAASTDTQHPLSAELGIAVAGTPTSLAAIDLQLDPYDPVLVHGHRLKLSTIQRILSELATMPLAERSRVTGLQPGRAPTIVAGAVILVAVMRAYGLNVIEVSEHDILHGVALELESSLNRVV